MAKPVSAPELAARPAIALALASVYLFWGSTFLAIKLAVETIPPFLTMGLRCAVAAPILIGIGLLQGARLPAGAAWWHAAAAGTLLFLVCHGGLAWVQQHVATGTTAVMAAVIPLWMVLIDAWISRRVPPLRVLVPLAVGFAGVVLIAATPDIAGQPVFLLLLGVTTFGWAAGSVVARRAAVALNAAIAAGMQMLTGGVLLFAASAALGEFARFDPAAVSLRSFAGLAFLVLFGSVTAFAGYVYLLRKVPGHVASSYAYVNPVVAVALGALLLDEQLTVPMIMGGVLVIGSVALVVTRR